MVKFSIEQALTEGEIFFLDQFCRLIEEKAMHDYNGRDRALWVKKRKLVRVCLPSKLIFDWLISIVRFKLV